MSDQNGQDVAKQAKQMANKVSQQLDAATAGLLPKRVMATFVDGVMIGVAGMIVNIIAFTLLPRPLSTLVSAVVLALSGIGMLLRDAPYTFGPLQGQSIGKKAMNIRVMTPSGDPITMQQAIRRNLLLGIPFFLTAVGIVISIIPFIGDLLFFVIGLPIGLISLAILGFEVFNMVRDPEHRRWGDFSAGTVVRFD